MKIVTVIPYEPLKCRAPGGCTNAAKHIVTIQRSAKLTFASIHVCDGHLKRIREAAED